MYHTTMCPGIIYRKQVIIIYGHVRSEKVHAPSKRLEFVIKYLHFKVFAAIVPTIVGWISCIESTCTDMFFFIIYTIPKIQVSRVCVSVYPLTS